MNLLGYAVCVVLWLFLAFLTYRFVRHESIRFDGPDSWKNSSAVTFGFLALIAWPFLAVATVGNSLNYRLIRLQKSGWWNKSSKW